MPRRVHSGKDERVGSNIGGGNPAHRGPPLKQQLGPILGLPWQLGVQLRTVARGYDCYALDTAITASGNQCLPESWRRECRALAQLGRSRSVADSDAIQCGARLRRFFRYFTYQVGFPKGQGETPKVAIAPDRTVSG